MDTPIAAGVTVKGPAIPPEPPVPTASPVPVRLTDCGEFDALATTVRAADSAPARLGVNVTLIWQLAPGANGGQLLVCAKSAALVPVTPMLVIDSAEVEELLVSVTV